jgi:hypothetical protein
MAQLPRPAADREQTRQRQKVRARLHVVRRTADRLGLRDATGGERPAQTATLPLEIEIRSLMAAVEVLGPRAAALARRDLTRIAGSITAVRQRQDTEPTERPVVPNEKKRERTWHAVNADLATALNDQWADDIRVEARRSDTMLWVDRILDAGGFCVAWTVVLTPDHAARLDSAGWTLWRPDRPVETKKKRGRVSAADFSTYRALVATVRSTTIPSLAAAVCDTLRTDHDPAHVVIRSQECSPAEHRRRMDALGVVERAARQSGRTPAGVVLTHCLGCGRPLTDHSSARAGYGPVCAGRVTGTRRPATLVPADVATIFRVVGKPLQQWRHQVARAAERLGVETR